jgi:hypothetical protein
MFGRVNNINPSTLKLIYLKNTCSIHRKQISSDAINSFPIEQFLVDSENNTESPTSNLPQAVPMYRAIANKQRKKETTKKMQ